MRHGALDYLEKPVDLEELATVISETIGERSSGAEAELPPLPPGLAVASEAVRTTVREVALVAPTDATVLLYRLKRYGGKP